MDSNKLPKIMLKFVLFIAWLFGCLPGSVTPPLSASHIVGTNTNSYTFHKKLILIIPCILYLASLATFIDFTLVNIYTASTTHRSLAETIVATLVNGTLHLTNLIRRVVLWIQQPKIVRLLLTYYNLETRRRRPANLDELDQSHPKSKATLLTFVTTISIGIGVSRLVNGILETKTKGVATLFFPDTSIPGVLYNSFLLCSFSSTLLAKGLVCILGEQLVKLYEAEVEDYIRSYGGYLQGENDLLASTVLQEDGNKNSQPVSAARNEKNQQFVKFIQVMSKSQSPVPRVPPLSGSTEKKKTAEEGEAKEQICWRDESLERFQQLQHCFHMFNDVAGPQAFFTSWNALGVIVWFSFKVVHSAWENWTLVWRIMIGIISFEHILNLWIFGHFGHVVQKTMKRSKDRIETMRVELNWEGDRGQDVSFNSNNGFKQHPILGDYILGWDWEFHACGLYAYNYAFFPRIISIVMTIVMFLVQLQLAEETSASLQIRRHT